MDTTTPHPADVSLQASLRHLRRMAAGGALALALLGAAAGLATPAHAAEPLGTSSHGTGAGGGKVSMQDLTRKVNEYEGQHRLAAAGDPSQWGLATGKDPEVPVIDG